LNNSFLQGFQALTYQLYINSLNEGLNLLGKEVTYLDQDETAKTGTVEALKQAGGRYVAVVDGTEVELEQISLIKR
jgi:SpoU rRNA methylase family enzyme